MSATSAAHPTLLSGSVYRTVIDMAWPVMATMLMEFMLAITNVFWIGRLGAQEQDAMTSSLIVIWSMFAMINLVTIGVNAIAARHMGANEAEDAGRVARQGLKLAGLAGLAYGIFGYFSSEAFLVFMQASPVVVAHGVAYLQVFFLTAPLFFLVDTYAAIFRATGDSKTPLYASAVAIILNLILDPLLIFGIGPFPKLGIAGAGWGLLISLCVAALVYVVFLNKRMRTPIANWFRERINVNIWWAIVKVGGPIASHQLIFIFVYWLIIRVVHHFGFVAGAALGIGNRIEAINYLVSSAFAIAASSIVGQCLGAKDHERAKKAANTSIVIGVCFTGITSLFYLLFPKAIAGVFTNDPNVLREAADYVVIVGISQVFMSIEIIVDGVFSGAGDTIPPMLVSIPGALLRVPLAYLLAIEWDWGINGVWWTISATCILKAVVIYLWFRRGKWLEKKLAA